jgi:Replication-relaxation
MPLTVVRITDRDRRMLAFAAEHKLVMARQLAALLGTSEDATAKRLRALRGAGLLSEDRPYAEQPFCYQITRAGLGVIESRLGPPKQVDRAGYRHDVGVGWLWLAAESGVWGELREVVSERWMRSRDRVRDSGAAPGERFGVRLGGTGSAGRERRHYPDLLLVDRDGRRIAVELELSAKNRPRLEGILAGYAADARIDVILYLVDRRSVGRAVQASAARLGIADLVHVQRVQWGSDAPTTGPARAPARVRPHRRARAAAPPQAAEL